MKTALIVAISATTFYCLAGAVWLAQITSQMTVVYQSLEVEKPANFYLVPVILFAVAISNLIYALLLHTKKLKLTPSSASKIAIAMAVVPIASLIAIMVLWNILFMTLMFGSMQGF